MNKRELLDHCIGIIEEKTSQIERALQELREGAESESKSTSGDKHETGRAMMHLEQEQLMKQLGEWRNQMQQLVGLKNATPQPNVYSGSLVTTDRGLFFISTAIGKVQWKDQTVFVISPQSPIGKAFLGKKEKEVVAFQQTSYAILEID